ncbi:hypothetical protein VNO77_31701 [Canavalia gladiata]|uniref:Uncharacterized protein n=1 Tax=Canavalia gladiata TaxID=3824 RepID=A0AAN9Q3T3_CANGL
MYSESISSLAPLTPAFNPTLAAASILNPKPGLAASILNLKPGFNTEECTKNILGVIILSSRSSKHCLITLDSYPSFEKMDHRTRIVKKLVEGNDHSSIGEREVYTSSTIAH